LAYEQTGENATLEPAISTELVLSLTVSGKSRYRPGQAPAASLGDCDQGTVVAAVDEDPARASCSSCLLSARISPRNPPVHRP
jgi:hypothetical protein